MTEVAVPGSRLVDRSLQIEISVTLTNVLSLFIKRSVSLDYSARS